MLVERPRGEMPAGFGLAEYLVGWASFHDQCGQRVEPDNRHIRTGIAAAELMAQETVEISRYAGCSALRKERSEQCLEIFTR